MNGHETLTPIKDTLLEKLDLNNKEVQFSILSYDKHQTLEGLQIEPLAMAYLHHLERFGVELPNVTTLIASQKGSHLSRCIFVWVREPDEISEAYINTLQRLAANTTFVVRYSEVKRTFYCHKPACVTKYYPLQTYLRGKRGVDRISFPEISQSVRDTERQMAVFWGRLAGAFSDHKKFQEEVVLNRILKNFVVQPFFTWLWDLDRIIRYKNTYWEIELKHKYPFERNKTLYFGLNVGQTKLVRELGFVGIRTLHIILVKPIWNKNIDPGYLFNRRDMLGKVLLIGTELTTTKAENMLKQKPRESDVSTSYSGKEKNNFLSISASDFYVLGSYETPPEKVAMNILNLLDGKEENLTQVTDQLLFDYKFI